MFEREISRCKLLEAREEEMKLKRRLTVQLEEETRKSLAKLEAKKKKILGKKETETTREEDEATTLLRLIEGDEEFSQTIMDFNDIIEIVTAKRSKRINSVERTVFERDQYY